MRRWSGVEEWAPPKWVILKSMYATSKTPQGFGRNGFAEKFNMVSEPVNRKLES